MAGAAVKETALADAKAVATLLLGIVTTPYRLVTQTIPNFYQAVTGRLDGEDRAWDVLLSGALLEGDVAATYGLAKAATAAIELATTSTALAEASELSADQLLAAAASEDTVMDAATAAQAATRLSEVGLDSPEAPALIRGIARMATRGVAGEMPDRVVIGPYFEEGQGFGYLQEVDARGGMVFDAPDEVWANLGSREIREAVNTTALGLLMESKVPRIELAGIDFDSVLHDMPDSYTAVEVEYLETEASEFGYSRVGNIWKLGGKGSTP